MNLQSLFRSAMLMMIMAFVGQIAEAQATTIKGWVLDENDEPVIGASVTASGNVGVVTDRDGQFSLNVNKGTMLTIKYVGYEDVRVKAENGMKVKLRPTSEQLDQLVVVGYGTQRKVNLTGSVQSITGDDIIRRNVSNGSNVLQGVVPGLTAVQGSGAPGGDASSITIRGVGSINSDTSPLVLIDGVEGDMNRIDLNTVESISVLKDAASASIYGARASNGVILITTKRGAQGKAKVSFNGYMGWNKPTAMPDPVDAVTYLTAMDQARVNNDQNPIYAETIQKYLDEGPDGMTLFDTDWRDLIMKKNAMMQNYSLSVSGGNEFARVFASAGYYKQDGMVPNNYFSRTNLRLNTDLKVNKFLDLGTDISIRQAEAHNPIGGAPTLIGYAMTFSPIWSAINADGTWGSGNRGGNNPVAAINAGGFSASTAPEYKAKISAILHPFKGLDVVGFYTWQRNDGRTYTFADTYELYEGGVSQGTYPTAYQAARENRSSATLHQYDVTATYQNTFGKHFIKGMVGYQSEEYKFSNLEGYRNTFPYDGYHDIGHGDATTATNSTYRYEWAMQALIFRLNYIFADRYLLEINGRYDGTSRFLKDKRWGFFPSVSAGWRISEESFMAPLRPVVSNLKLRGSFGKLGNQNLSGTYFPYLSAVASSQAFQYPFDKTLQNGAAQTQLANPNITWEKSIQWDLGLDWSLFNNRLSGTFDFYHRKIEDMLQQFQVPNFVGLASPWVNGGSMRNVGWELSLTWNDRIGPDFTYSITANLSDVRNKVLDLLGNEYKADTRYTTEGHPFSCWYAYVADGFFTSYDQINAMDEEGNYLYAVYGERGLVKPGYIRYKDIDGNGRIDGDDRQILSDSRPHWEYGVNLSCQWKGIDFSALIQGVGQKDVYYSGAGAKPFYGGGTAFYYQLDTWSEENPDAKFPLLLNDPNGEHPNNLFSTFWIQSGAYCRLKNLTLGYTLPRKWTQKCFIERVRFYASAQNLLTFKGNNFYEGFDPEMSNSGSMSCYPLNKTFLFGLNIDF